MSTLLDTTAIPDQSIYFDDRDDNFDCDSLPLGVWFTRQEMCCDPELMYFADEDLEHHGAYSRPKRWGPDYWDYTACIDYGPQDPRPVPRPDDEYDDMSIWSTPALTCA